MFEPVGSSGGGSPTGSARLRVDTAESLLDAILFACLDEGSSCGLLETISISDSWGGGEAFRFLLLKPDVRGIDR